MLVCLLRESLVPSDKAYHVLGRQVDLRERVVAGQSEAIGEGTGGGVRPAGATVLRDVLVAIDGGVVHARHIADVVGIGGILWQRTRGCDKLALVLCCEVSVETRVVEEAKLRYFGSRGLLGNNSLGRRVGPRAGVLDAEVVLMHADLGKTLVSPVGTPGVAQPPVLGVAVLVKTPTDNAQNVVGHRQKGLLLENLARVGRNRGRGTECLQLIGGINAASQGAACEDLGLQLVGIGQLLSSGVVIAAAVGTAVLVDSVLAVRFDGSAVRRSVRAGAAVLADAVGLALAIDGLVVLARLVRDAVLLDVVEHTADVTTFATAASTTVDEHLGSQDSVNALSIVLDLQAVGQTGESAVSPARPTVLRDVLVARLRQEVGAVHIAPVEVAGQVVGVHDLVWAGIDNVFLLQQRRDLGIGGRNGQQQGSKDFHGENNV